jgi:histidinol dehydrogenase
MLDALKTIPWSGLEPSERQRLLARPQEDRADLAARVSAIIDRVRNGGDTALAKLTLELDRCKTRHFSTGPERLRAATKRVDSTLLGALQDASERIRQFHEADMPAESRVETAPGLTCEVRYQPLSPVGLYIPGGSAPLVSTALMLAIPAALAGCKEVVMCSPPGADGEVADEILAAAGLCGVERVFAMGGAQAVAAMAYGTETVPKCVKIFGPGNAWVTEAKQQVSQDPDGAAIDMPAGPSEVLVIGDKMANPEFIAWDLLSQAEHGPDSQVILLSDSRTLAEAVISCIRDLAPRSPRAGILQRSLSACRIVLVDSLDEAVTISNEYAPEHLIINTADAAALAERVRNAGSVFVGAWTPESLGDYCSGTNHVLPTYGWARAHGALGMSDFMRRMTFQTASREALEHVGPTAETLAGFEGLDAHRMAVACRRGSA